MSAGFLLTVFFAGSVLVGAAGILRLDFRASQFVAALTEASLSLAFCVVLLALGWMLLPSGGGVLTLGMFYTGAFVVLQLQAGAVWVGAATMGFMAVGFLLPLMKKGGATGERVSLGWDRLAGLSAVALASVAGNLITMFIAVALAIYCAYGEAVPWVHRWHIRGGVFRMMAVMGAASLLVSIVELYVQHGTSNFSAIPVGAATSGIAIPWLLAALMLLVAPVVALSPGGPVVRWSWLTLPAVALQLLNALMVTESPALPADVQLPAALCGSALLLGVLWLATCTRWIRYRMPMLYLGLVGLSTLDFAVGSQSAWGVLSILLCLAFILAVSFFFVGALVGTEPKPGAAALLSAGVAVGYGFLGGLLSLSVLAGWSFWTAPAVALVLCTTGVLVYRGIRDFSVQLPLHIRSRATWRKLLAGALLLGLVLFPLLLPGVFTGTSWQLLALGTAPATVTPEAVVVVGGAWPGAYVFAAAILVWVGATAGWFAMSAEPHLGVAQGTPSALSAAAQDARPGVLLSVSSRSLRAHVIRIRRSLRLAARQLDALELFLVDQPRLAAVILEALHASFFSIEMT